ncbi:translation initiation factor eif3-like protein [Babesia gibsoni]|uniref:tRNA (adenine(58)-N(1))-methyltransferase non-catalytic subunit TRM6 n=1 Tax=Babesia gibsoni TaxID=33632 RepID=A0AAD8LRU0_BABGI|nr:translation initiation factor eif3-like protein [Babesia gibsoni]
MEYQFSRDISLPVRENDTVILMVHNKGGFTVKIERGRTIKICKERLKLDMLINCSYGDFFTKEGEEWIKVKRGDPNYQLYRNRIKEKISEDVHNHTSDNRDIHDDNSAQKLSYDEIQRMKKDMNAHDLIETIVDNSETFSKKTKMAQEKYIMRKEKKHMKLFYIRPCDLYNVCNCYFTSFPHKIGYMNFANLGMILYMANILHGFKVMVLDHSLGLLTGAISQRLAGSGKIYRLVTKGVSDKIIHELGVTNFDNIISIDMDEYLENGEGINRKTLVNRELKDVTPTDNHVKTDDCGTHVTDLDEFITTERDTEDSQGENITTGEPNLSNNLQNGGTSNKRRLEGEDPDDLDDMVTTRKKKQAIPGIYPLHHPNMDEVTDCQVVIGNISFNKCDKLNRVVHYYTFKLKEGADKYLEMGGRLVVFGQQYQPMASLQAALTRSENYVNVKFEEVFIREHQMIQLRTHPLMRAEVRPFCGFIVSATKTSSDII